MEFFSAVEKGIQAFTPMYATAGGAVVVDGPLPIGDTVGVGIAIIATIGAIGYGIAEMVKTEPKAPAISISKDRITTVPKAPSNKTQYWSADDKATRGTPITYAQALARVKSGGNIFASNQIAAYSVAKWFPNSFLDGPHKGGIEGYYPHYHTGKHGPPHIWFYP